MQAECNRYEARNGWKKEVKSKACKLESKERNDNGSELYSLLEDTIVSDLP
jgi:hypothetical protein